MGNKKMYFLYYFIIIIEIKIYIALNAMKIRYKCNVSEFVYNEKILVN